VNGRDAARRALRFMVVALGLAGPLRADVAPVVAPPPSATNLWFNVGERLVYDIAWGYLSVGRTEVETEWVVHTDGRTLLAVRFKTRTNGVVEHLYPVEDLQETLIDPETFLPVQFLKKSRQGKRRYHELTRFDHAAKKAYWENFIKNRTKEVAIEADTRDIIGLMYHMRATAHEVGSSFHTRVFTDEKLYDLFVKVPKKEKIDLEKYGPVASLRFDPEAAFNGLFVRKGKMTLWVSDDPRRLCTRITAEVPVAKIRISLTEVTGPGDDFWVGRHPPGSPENTLAPRGVPATP
jgi:hypothetical protein